MKYTENTDINNHSSFSFFIENIYVINHILKSDIDDKSKQIQLERFTTLSDYNYYDNI
jgi:hypothetical protein